MKVAFVMIVYNGMPWLEPCLESILPYGPVFVAEGPVAYFREQGAVTSTDGTNEVLARMLPAENVVRGTWQEKDDMMRATERLIPPETTHLWMVDSDEIWRAEDLQSIIDQLDQWDSVSVKPLTFFGGFSHVLTGFELRFTWYRIQRWYPGASWATHRPPTVNAPDGRPWNEHRHWDSGYRFFHYSYVLPSQVKSKVAYYATRGKTIPDWYHRVYLRWVLGNEKERQAVEKEFRGVHEWLPARRGECFTRPFEGQHPPAIQKRLPELRARFMRELEAV